MKSSSFPNFVEDQLESIDGLRLKRMFGGHGLYAGEVFFGIIHRDRLYFHTDDETVKRYEEAGMTCFITPARQKALKRYYEVPLSVIEQQPELLDWARTAVASVHK